MFYYKIVLHSKEMSRKYILGYICKIKLSHRLMFTQMLLTIKNQLHYNIVILNVIKMYMCAFIWIHQRYISKISRLKLYSLRQK